MTQINSQVIKVNTIGQQNPSILAKVQKRNTFDSNQTDQNSLKTSLYEENIQKIVKQRYQILNPMMSVSYKTKPLKIKSAKGQYFYQQNGQRTLDCINNVSHIGHCNPYYIQKMQQQMTKLVTNSRFLYDQLLIATKKILKKFPKQLCVVTFVNSGSQANDLALQMAKIHTGKKGVICLQGAYHGITNSCHDISPYKWNSMDQKPDYVTIAKSPCTYRGFLSKSTNPQIDYPKYINQIIKQDTGAFISQLMQSCAGQIIPPKNMYKPVYQQLRNKKIVCIADEVQTGFGRIGQNFWAFQYYDIIPDIVTIGKAMGNGFPVSAVVCTKQIAQSYKNRGIQFFSTFGGNPLASVAVNAVLDVIQNQKLQQNACQNGKYLFERLQQLRKYSFVGDIRGVGFFQGIDIVKSLQTKQQDGQKALQIISLMRKKNIIVSRDGVHENILKFKPPLVFNRQNINQLVDALHVVMKQIQQKEKQKK